ncbi:PREDICTED: homeobox-leucine zipper protein HOX11-like [Nelumbo nucifera]|uniref:Homeobox-leucine zipper protein HOX11-like n=1 Tax=Nelumbo nucifera TaxID=4432 RepID=A0A1U7YM69_NELNU|nr:PREDICTED: homeobox-leucine zipper protein HOX11-like [Nelumbo nucifera]
MELGFNLGDASNAFAFADKSHKLSAKDLGFCVGLGVGIVNGNSEAGSTGHLGATTRGFDVNRLPAAKDANDGNAVSSPNCTVSSFQMDFSIYRGGSGGNKRDAEASGNEVEAERASSRASDEEENGLTRKKLRLSKEQSTFLEESFEEHNTVNPFKLQSNITGYAMLARRPS